MVFIFLVLFVTAIILWVANRKDEATRWAVFFLLCGSSGSLGVTIEQSILPSLHQYKIDHIVLNEVLYRIQIYSSYFNQLFFPYAVLMYAIVESGLIRRNVKRILAYTLLGPVLIMMVTTPVINEKIRINYKLILIWVVPYLLITCFLLVFAYWKERNRARRKHRLRTVIMIVPTVAAILALNYIAKALQLGIPIYRYLAFFVGFSFVMFLTFAFAREALGVRLRFERQRLDTAMRAMTSGASFVNHTIKNEMGKIKVLANRAHSLAAVHDQKDIQRYVGSIQEAAEHLLAMSSRLHSQLQDFKLKESIHAIESLVEDSLLLVSPLLNKKAIQLIRERYPPFDLLCDSVLIREAFMNICTNAVEAMSEGGTLYITVYRTKRWVTVEFKDNGSGIPKEIRGRLIEPFFSTKRKNTNMGLGLSFCFNVMQKHDGMLEIDSEESVGTTVALHFPNKRITESVQRIEKIEKPEMLAQ